MLHKGYNMDTNYIKAVIDMSQARVDFEQKRFANKQSINKLVGYDTIIDSLKTKGYAVVENFYSEQKCRALREEIDRIHKLHENDGFLWTDKYDADKRVFGAEVDSDLIREFYEDEFLLDVAQNYFGSTMFNSNTLAAKIDATAHNIGSGQGWHRDAHHFQFKAIVYLSDVTIDNGPFQIIEESHRSGNALRNMVTMGIKDMTTRYTDEQIQKVIDEDLSKYKILTGKAGTLVFADTSSLHTGMPIKKGHRYSLFNYYCPSWENKEGKRRYFNCVLKVK